MMEHKIEIKWLGNQNRDPQGITWGIPWEKGALQRGETITMEDHAGNPVPVQSWPQAFWPDGSVKWTAHAASFLEKPCDSFVIEKGEPCIPVQKLHLQENESTIQIDTGKLQCRINKSGNEIIGSIIQ